MADEDTKGTAQAGSEPAEGDGAKGRIPDSQGAGTGSPSGDEDESKLPFNQHPKWQSARKTEKAVQDLMKANDLETFEELVELFSQGKDVLGKVGDASSLEQALDDSRTLARYREYWASQKEQQRRENESPEETIARLERENSKLQGRQRKEKEAQDEVEQSKKAIRSYSQAVSEFVKGVESVPEDLRPHLAWMAGVNNDFAEIDITDQKAVKRMMQGVTKRWQDIEKLVIANYLKQKGSPPKVPTQAGTTPTDATKAKTFKLREARAALSEAALKSVFRK